MNPFADLHCHTTCSDGSATPEEILDLAVKMGFKGVSITDHDTVAAYEGLSDMASARGLEILTGVEFSCTHQGISVHILGYNFNLNADPLLKLIARHKNRREVRNDEILHILKKRGMSVELELIEGHMGAIGRPHIALAMIKKGYVTTVKEAFQKYLAEGRPCFSPGNPISVEETLEIIHKSQGKAIIAHPHLLKNSKTLQALLQMPFEGMETTYGNFSPEKNKRWHDLAQRKGWLETGGSDYHGTLKPTLSYGASYVDESQFRQLQQ